MRYLTVLLFPLLLCALSSDAQHFRYRARLQQVPEDGFYAITLNPELKARSRDHWEDLRLIDQQGKEVPYMLRDAGGPPADNLFVPYPVTAQGADDSTQYLVVEHNTGQALDRITLELDNAEAQRQLSVSGSNDGREWYVVKDAFRFDANVSPEPKVYREINFPRSDYRFYKLTIRNGQQAPLHVLRAGYLQVGKEGPLAYYRVSGSRMTRKDSSDKHTYIRIDCTPANRIDRLVLHISAPEQYRRAGLMQLPGMPAGEFVLSSGTEPVIHTTELAGTARSGCYLLDINNQDDLPLQIDSISAWQQGVVLVARLSGAGTYHLYCGDSLLAAPAYDIVYFKDKIPGRLPGISTDSLSVVSSQPAAVARKKDNRYLVWIALIVAGIAIGFMTRKMLRELKEKDAADKPGI